MDWHEVALGLMAIIITAGGWVWTNTIKQLGKLGDKMDEHQQSDSAEFAALHREISDNQIALLERIAGRWNDR